MRFKSGASDKANYPQTPTSLCALRGSDAADGNNLDGAKKAADDATDAKKDASDAIKDVVTTTAETTQETMVSPSS